jgi:hypothetical protein
MDVLESENLKGVFFIEAVHALKLGTARLREMVQTVQTRGHEAALHIHTEWLKWTDNHPLGDRNGQHLKDFSAADQQWIVSESARLLRSCGVDRIASFRAGNYGANRNTLRALANEGVTFDSSYNIAFLGTQCGIDIDRPLTRPERMEGLVEVPISFITDYPGHHRPMQIMAASFPEMRAALDNAERRGFPSFVFVSHGFELIRRRREHRGGAKRDAIVQRRFERLVRYLGRNKDRYQVTTFSDTTPDQLLHEMPDDTPLQGSVLRTAARVAEQAWRRVTDV